MTCITLLPITDAHTQLRLHPVPLLEHPLGYGFPLEEEDHLHVPDHHHFVTLLQLPEHTICQHKLDHLHIPDHRLFLTLLQLPEDIFCQH